MKKTFIPKEFRPSVPGSSLKSLNRSVFEFPRNSENRPEKYVILSSQGDLVAKKVWESLKSNKTAIHFYLDELGYTWDFSYSNERLTLLTPSGKITPLSIYHRHPGVAQDHPFYSKHISLFEVMDIWKGNSIGQKRDHFHNTSKPYQIIHSVLQAVKKINTDKVGIAKTYLVKGNIREIKSRLDKQYIVKSCSSMRSIAATEQDYNSWEMQDLKNVPVMFQEYIDGTDYRIHFMDDYTWTLSVISKDRADYRYSSKHSLEYRLETIPSELDDFCKDLSKIEDNRFIGVDLIKTGDRYVCLESNPGPDWSTFYHPSRDQFNHFFIQTLAQEEKGYHV